MIIEILKDRHRLVGKTYEDNVIVVCQLQLLTKALKRTAAKIIEREEEKRGE